MEEGLVLEALVVNAPRVSSRQQRDPAHLIAPYHHCDDKRRAGQCGMCVPDEPCCHPLLACGSAARAVGQALPVLLLFLLLQRYIVGGLTSGSVKG